MRASPKSAILTSPRLLTRTFAGLRSRCSTMLVWRKSKPCSSCDIKPCADRQQNGDGRQRKKELWLNSGDGFQLSLDWIRYDHRLYIKMDDMTAAEKWSQSVLIAGFICSNVNLSVNLLSDWQLRLNHDWTSLLQLPPWSPQCRLWLQIMSWSGFKIWLHFWTYTLSIFIYSPQFWLVDPVKRCRDMLW